MKNKVPKGLWLAVAIGFFVASAAVAQPVVNFGITAAGPTGNNLAGVFTDPYQGCVNCTANTPGTAVQIFCDDFTDDVNPPEYWTAFATNLNAFLGGADVNSVYYASSVTSSSIFSALPSNLLTPANNTTWSAEASAGFGQTTAYIAAAILAAQSIAAGPGDAIAQNDLSFALWGIFDPTLLDTTLTASTYGTMDSTNLKAAQTDLENALLTASTYSSGADFTAKTGISATIYSECTGCSVGQSGIGAVATAKTRPQEMITVKTPEPTFASLLATDLAGLTLLGLFFRRRERRKTAR